jgi:hypothetical protein
MTAFWDRTLVHRRLLEVRQHGVRSQKAVIPVQPQGLSLEPVATKRLKIEEAPSISPVRFISMLLSQASRKSPRIWLHTPLKSRGINRILSDPDDERMTQTSTEQQSKSNAT